MSHDPKELVRVLESRARARSHEAEVRIERARQGVERVLRSELRQGALRQAWLIGTAAWGGAHLRSDVDVVVEGLSLESFAPLWDELSEAAGMDVDLLRFEELDQDFQARVREEGVGVHGA